jgi:PAS domain S-box-containing protein
MTDIAFLSDSKTAGALTLAAVALLWAGLTAVIYLKLLKSRQLERELYEKKVFLDTIIKHMPLGLFAKDVKAGYPWVLWNPYMEKLFGLKPEEVIGLNDYDKFSKKEADFFRATDVRVMSSRKVVIIPSEEITTPKRGTWLARTIKVPIYDEKGEASILLGILDDITDRVQAEKQVHEYSRGMEKQYMEMSQAHAQATHAIAATVTDLRDALRESPRDEEMIKILIERLATLTGIGKKKS